MLKANKNRPAFQDPPSKIPRTTARLRTENSSKANYKQQLLHERALLRKSISVQKNKN